MVSAKDGPIVIMTRWLTCSRSEWYSHIIYIYILCVLKHINIHTYYYYEIYNCSLHLFRGTGLYSAIHNNNLSAILFLNFQSLIKHKHSFYNGICIPVYRFWLKLIVHLCVKYQTNKYSSTVLQQEWNLRTQRYQLVKTVEKIIWKF